MARRATSGLLSQYAKNAGGASAAGCWLKFYNASYGVSTSTAKTIYTQQSGGSSLAKCKLNTRGEPINNSSDDDSTFIPYIVGDYDAYIFFTSADADANNTENAIFLGTNIQEVNDDQINPQFATVLDMKSGSALNLPATVDFADYVGRKVTTVVNNTTSNKGGADYTIWTLAAYRAAISNPTWVPDGHVHHYLLGATTYVAIMDFGKGDSINADACGCSHDASISDSAALNAAFSYKKTIIFSDGGNYYVDAEVVVPNGSFDARAWWCDGQFNMISMSGYTGNQINVTGGSGDMNRALTARGGRHIGDSTTGTAIHLRGCNGFRYYEPYFSGFDEAVVMHNQSSGEFTEGCIIVGARFKNCNHDLVLRRTSGNNSFHGSGLFQCWLNPINGQSPIVVESGCLWYNGVLDINCFTAGIGTPIIDMQASESPQQSVTGNLRLEGQINPIVGGAGSDTLNLIGGVTTLNETHYGRLNLCRAIINTGPEASNATIIHAENYSKTFLTTTTNANINLGRDGRYTVVSSDCRFIVEVSNNLGSMPHMTQLRVISGVTPPPSRFTNSGDNFIYIEPSSGFAVQVFAEPSFNPASTSAGKTLEYYETV